MSGRKQKMLWIIDLLCLLGFLVALTPSITGLQIHEWLGLAAAGALLVHVLLHRGWIVSVTRRLNAIRSRKIIWRYNLNVGLFVSFTTILVTGILISSTFNLGVERYALWRFLHVLASYMTLGLLVVKIALHWQWIVKTTRHHILQLPTVTAQPVTVSTLAGERFASEHAASRREFLATAGWATVGLACWPAWRLPSGFGESQNRIRRALRQSNRQRLRIRRRATVGRRSSAAYDATRGVRLPTAHATPMPTATHSAICRKRRSAGAPNKRSLVSSFMVGAGLSLGCGGAGVLSFFRPRSIDDLSFS